MHHAHQAGHSVLSGIKSIADRPWIAIKQRLLLTLTHVTSLTLPADAFVFVDPPYLTGLDTVKEQHASLQSALFYLGVLPMAYQNFRFLLGMPKSLVT